jgi:hypothetical protein
VLRNVGILNSEAGELPRRKHTIYINYLSFILLSCKAIRLKLKVKQLRYMPGVAQRVAGI